MVSWDTLDFGHYWLRQETFKSSCSKAQQHPTHLPIYLAETPPGTLARWQAITWTLPNFQKGRCNLRLHHHRVKCSGSGKKTGRAFLLHMATGSGMLLGLSGERPARGGGPVIPQLHRRAPRSPATERESTRPAAALHDALRVSVAGDAGIPASRADIARSRLRSPMRTGPARGKKQRAGIDASPGSGLGGSGGDRGLRGREKGKKPRAEAGRGKNK